MTGHRQLQDPPALAAQVRSVLERIRKMLPLDCLRPAFTRLVPHFVRADRLANHYQHLYLRAGMLVYGLAAAFFQESLYSLPGLTATALRPAASTFLTNSSGSALMMSKVL